jgi:hypothetical protein
MPNAAEAGKPPRPLARRSAIAIKEVTSSGIVAMPVVVAAKTM